MTSHDIDTNELLEKLSELPFHRRKEVLDFIEFLKVQERKQEETLLDVAGCLSGKPLSVHEIEEELYGETKE